MMFWNSAQYSAMEWAPYSILLNLTLAISFTSISPNALWIAFLNSFHVVKLLHPSVIEGWIHFQAAARHRLFA